jgi:hypothetical protein
VRKLKTPISILVLFFALAATVGNGEQSDEEKQLRELFLKSRQQMEIVPSPTPSPTPRPTPSPALSPGKQPSIPPRQEPKRTVTPAPQFPAHAFPSQPLKEQGETKLTPAQEETITPQTASPENSPNPSEESPSSTPKRKKHWFFFGKPDDETIVVQKSGSETEKDLAPAPTRGGRWHYLTPAVRMAIDDARVARNRWKYVIVHNSGTRQGNARIFDYYHRHVRKMPNGLAYHFVIGNGTSSGNGQVEIGSRWTQQLNGGHVHSDYLNYISLGICLVGDFNRDLPTRSQYEALDELIRYLRQRVGKVDGRYSAVRGHREINPRPTDCPGNRFPLNWLHRTFPD